MIRYYDAYLLLRGYQRFSTWLETNTAVGCFWLARLSAALYCAAMAYESELPMISWAVGLFSFWAVIWAHEACVREKETKENYWKQRLNIRLIVIGLAVFTLMHGMTTIECIGQFFFVSTFYFMSCNPLVRHRAEIIPLTKEGTGDER